MFRDRTKRQTFVWQAFCLRRVIFQPVLAIFIKKPQHMATLRCFCFTLSCQNVNILGTDLHDLIINELYTLPALAKKGYGQKVGSKLQLVHIWKKQGKKFLNSRKFPLKWENYPGHYSVPFLMMWLLLVTKFVLQCIEKHLTTQMWYSLKSFIFSEP